MNRKIIVGACALVAYPLFATTCTWIGSSGNWSDPNNWQNSALPSSADTAEFPSSADITVTVDVAGGVSLARLTTPVEGTGKVTFEGETITFKGLNLMTFYSPVDFKVPIVIEYAGTTYHKIGAKSTVAFYGPMTIDDSITTLQFASESNAAGGGPYEFHSTVSGGNRIMSTTTFNVREGANFAVPRLMLSMVWSEQENRVYASELSAQNLYCGRGKTYFHVSNAMKGAVIRPGWNLDSGTTSSGSIYLYDDQTFDRFDDNDIGTGIVAWNASTKAHTLSNDSGRELVLTLNGTANGNSPIRMYNKTSIVWNPQGDFVQTFSNRVISTTGSLTVKRGAIRMVGCSTFASVPAITIADGASFVDESTSSSSLSGLKTLTMGDNSRFVIAASAGTTPISGLTKVTMGVGAKLELPSGCALSADVLSAGGVFPAVGTYTGVGGAIGATEVPWIVGAGTVTVANANLTAWKLAQDGTWSEAQKWNLGVLPSTAAETYITAAGVGYTVGLNVSPLAVGAVTIGNDSSHTTTLAVSEDVSVASTTYLNVTKGGRWLQTAGTVSVESKTAPFKVGNGGRWRQEGGEFTFANTNGKVFTVEEGGCVEIVGGTASFENTQQDYNTSFVMNGGSVDVSGTGILTLPTCTGNPQNFSIGNITVRDSGQFIVNNNTFTGNGTSDSLVVNVGDCAYFKVAGTCQLKDGVRFDLASSVDSFLGNSCNLIGKTAPSIINVLEGGAAEVNNYMFGVGQKVASDTAASCPTGMVTIAGRMKVSGAAIDWSGRSADSYDGTAIGLSASSYAPTEGAKKLRPTYGSLTVTPTGYFENTYGLFGVGVGACASGVLAVDGGALTNKATRASAVGWAGGLGELKVMNGGRAKFARSLYVGGMPMEVVGKSFSAYVERETTTSEGVVSVTNGSLTVAGDIVLGALGSGMLDIQTGGSVTANDLILSNNVVSTLKFTIGPTTLDYGTVELAGKLKVEPGAKLVIDGSTFAAEKGMVRLLSAVGGIEGSFADADVTVIGPKLQLRLTSDGIYAGIPSGLLLIVR